MSRTFTLNMGKTWFLVLFSLLSYTLTKAQTTITTIPATTFNGGNSVGAPGQVTFVVNNTNPYPILLTGVSQYLTTADNNSIWQLYYSSTSLSGPSTDVTTAPWTLVATAAATPATATGITPLNFTGLSFTIPAGTQYRFALRTTGPGSVRYSGTGTALTPNTFTADGVTLAIGDYQIGGSTVGYSGTGTGVTLTPRYFTGAIRFQPAGPCTNPPVPGTLTSTSNPVCLNLPFTLSLTGGTGGTGQTYQWQISPDNSASSWTNISGATSATLSATQAASNYYRVQVTCGGTTVNSASLLVTTPAAVGGTFTINRATPTGGTNFASFNDAYNYIKCGISNPVTFNVVPNSGPYNEQLVMEAVPGASATNTITFNGNGNAISFTSTNTNERAVIKLDGADHVTFDSLVVNAGGTTTTEYGFGFHLINNADSNTINRCTINVNTTSTSTQYAGIVMSASATSAITAGSTFCDRNIISNNTITGGYYGVTLVGSNSDAVMNNQVINNNIRDWYLYGVYTSGTFNALIEGNDIQRPTRANSGATIYGIYSTGLSTNGRISRNRIHSIFDGETATTNDFNGIFFTGVDALAGFDNVISNNIIYDIKGNGTIYGINNTSSDNVQYYHNTISLDHAASTATEPTRGFYQTTAAAGIEFRNNLVTINRGGTGTKHAIYMNTATTTYISNNNNFFVAAGPSNFVGYNGTNRATLNDWQTNTTPTAQDAASISVNPIYADLANGLLMPTNATMNDRGSNAGITTDIQGTTRSTTTPDIGAYEFTPGGCMVPPTPGTALVNQTPVCANSPVTLSLTGNSIGSGQTYQWQSSASSGTGFASIGNVLTNPDTAIVATTTLYYRVAVTCNGNTTFSTPVLVTVNPALAGGTYTINRALPTGGTNFASFNDAKAAMACGISASVTFNVVANSGPYNEQLILDTIRGTSPARTVTFNGNGNTITFLSTNTNERAVIKFNGADHVTFNNLVIDVQGSTTTEYGFGVQFTNNSDFNTISGCTINVNTTSTSTNYAGIVMSASATSATTTGATLSDNNTLINNTITGGYYGITMVGATTGTPIYNNSVLGNTIREFYFYGVYVSGTEGTQIEANSISRPTRSTFSTFYGVYFTGMSDDARVSRNRIFNPFGSDVSTTSLFGGIYFTGVDAPAAQKNVVSNNAIYGVSSEGTVYGIYNSSSDNVDYHHNTISLDDRNSTSGNVAYGFYQITAASGIDLKNNLISITRGGTGNKFGINFATAATTFTSNYNNVYVSASNAFFGFSGANQATLAAWQAATSQDAASLSINPIFASAATGNLTSLNGALDNKGTPAGVAADINGAPRSITTPDIGAWEFSVPPCTTPPTPGTSLALPSTGICMGTPIQLSLTGNSAGAGQTYQWQTSTTLNGTYTDLGTPLLLADTTVISTSTMYYRVAVTCSGSTQYSAPVLVTLNPAFLSGFYTINPAQPASTTNFQNFASAVAALDCGVTGFVTFNVAPGTYTEQIRIRSIGGTGANSRITFQSASGDPSSVTLTFNSTAAASNYTLKLDSASYFSFRNMTITGTNTTNGRVIELANTASFDSIVNCVITAPISATSAINLAGIYATALRGSNNVIKGNTVTGGSAGIYITGVSATNLTRANVIDSNSVSGGYIYGIYNGNSDDNIVSRNTVTTATSGNTSMYGIYGNNMDSAYQVINNRVAINNVTAGTTYGIYLTGSTSSPAQRGRVASNTITGTGNTSTVYGMYQTTSIANNTVNNVISIQTTGATSYGLYSTGGGGVNYHNNSVNSTATSATNNVAAYFSHTSSVNGVTDIRNNVFAHNGGGRALYITNLYNLYSDYNFLYTSGSTLVQLNTTNLADLKAWRDTSNWDINSIAYIPAFTSSTDLRPNLTNPDAWAMHGRGVQIAGNNADFDNNPRPTTLAAGVPDMGAYEFLPTVAPPALPANPATPAPGTTQTFMFGTDTVQKITWGPGAVPTTVSVRRYSGVLPTGLSAGTNAMYFYTDVQTTGSPSPAFTMQQFYIDPWLGLIPSEGFIKMGRTNAANTWVVSNSSVADTMDNIIREEGLSHLGRFTGLSDGALPPSTSPVFVQQVDSSNQGKRFWVAYGHHQNFSSNTQDMVLYLSAEQAANVTVSINGTPWKRTYQVPANTVRLSDIIPKSGLYDARQTIDGKSNRGILIESDVPIVAYAHIYASTTSEAAMLMPTGTWGYEYTALTTEQNYGSDTYSWMMVVADRDNTRVQITPSNPTLSGSPAGVPFTVTLNKGEVYQVLGALIGSGPDGYDLTGTKVRSLPNADGKCYPIGVFSGSSRTNIDCQGFNASASGDNIFEQNFPYQAWGKRYLTAPTSNSSGASSLHTNIFRVAVKDPATVVRRNGTQLTGIVGNFYYEFESNTADLIEADKPITVAQIMASSTFCANTSGNGDPAMIYVSPLEQGVKRVGLYRNTRSSITSQYVTLIIPTAGVASLQIDNSNTFDHTYAHPNMPGYTVVVKRWSPAANAQVIIQSDSAFTAITYGLGSVESYGYNAGTLVKNLNALPSIINTLNPSGTVNQYTCAKSPFRVNVRLPMKPTTLTWQMSAIPSMTPNANVIQNNPTPADSSLVNGTWYYSYSLPADYAISTPGTFNIPILVTHPEIEGCNNTSENMLTVNVLPTPVANFTVAFPGCVGSTAQFTGIGTTSNNVSINSWAWTFHDNTTANTQNASKQYNTAGTFNVRLRIIGVEGCVGDTTKTVTVNAAPTVAMVADSISICTNGTGTFTVQNPVAGATYAWYTSATGGTPVFTGNPFTTPALTATTQYFVEASQNGCTSASRTRVIASVLPPLTNPVAAIDSAGTDMIRFRWAAVANASSYEVSIDNGATWITPSSGATGLTHTVTGLQPLQSVTLIVKAKGGCQDRQSAPVTARTLPTDIFIPNSFTPNGDGLNDVLRVYGYTIKEMQFMVFNQWGEKIFESRSQSVAWDGTFKGQVQPSGVYMYVCRMVLRDGTVETKKGSINLIR